MSTEDCEGLYAALNGISAGWGDRHRAYDAEDWDSPALWGSLLERRMPIGKCERCDSKREEPGRLE